MKLNKKRVAFATILVLITALIVFSIGKMIKTRNYKTKKVERRIKKKWI